MNASKLSSTTQVSAKIEGELQAPPSEQRIGDIDPEKLAEEARERAKKGPVVQRLLQAIKRERKPFREIIINAEPLEQRVAFLVDGVLEKFDIERAGEDRMVGSIFNGKDSKPRAGPSSGLCRYRDAQERLPTLLGHYACGQRLIR